MLPYIIAGVVALVLLGVAYRTLGGSASAPADPALVLRAVCDAADEALHALGDALQRDLTLGTPPPELQRVRRRVEGCAQQLQQLDTAALSDDLAAAHALLACGVDELSWCARAMLSAAYAGAAGLQSASHVLHEHARACVDHAAAMLPLARAEEAERPGEAVVERH